MIYELNKAYFVRPLEEADMSGPYRHWFEDQEVCRFNSHGKFFQTEAQLRAYLRDLGRSDRIVWAICHVKDGHVGNVSLQDISFVDRSADFAIILGNKRHWGRNLGKLAGGALVRHGFRKLNLERISCGTAATNEGMKKLALALGMKKEGTRRKALFLDGARVDVIEYGILRGEFRDDTD